MFITPITRLDSVEGLSSSSPKMELKTNDFRNIFTNAINDVKETEDVLSKENYKFVTGQSEDTHSLSIAATKAQISVDTLISIRNRALDAYNELMRINL